jgi:hypothetical protein
MIFDMSNPFSGLHGEVNGATARIMQHEADKEMAVKYLKHLIADDVDVNDPLVIKRVLRFYNLEDISKAEALELVEKATN